MTTKEQVLSERAANIEASITMSVTALANQLKKEGKAVIGMSAGEPDFDTPEPIKQAGIQALNEGKTKYTAANGIVELKSAICDKLKRDHDLDYENSNIVVSCGAKHTIFNILMAMVNPGDEVIFPSPYWVSYPDQVNIVGGKSVVVETTDQTGFKLTADQLEAVITPRSKILILNSPSNPTGMVYSRDELKAIAEVALKHDLWVISDEIYEQLIYEGDHFSIAQVSPEMKDRTLLVNGLSKAYSMTGWRIGYAAVPQSIAVGMTRLQSHSTSNPTTMAQWAGVEALNGDQTCIATMKEAFLERRNTMVDTLNGIPGITCLKPQGAFYAFPNVSGLFGKKTKDGTELTNTVQLCEKLLQEKLVACVPGSGFGAEGYLRLSYATSMDAINEALTRLSEWVEELS